MKKIILRTLLVVGSIILILFLNLVLFNAIASKISKGEPITSTGSDITALLVVDIQEGTTGSVSETESYKNQAEELIRNTNQVLEKAQEMDWKIIYIRTEVVNPLINILNHTMAKRFGGVELDNRLAMKPGTVITKRRNDSFIRTELDQVLRDQKVERLVVTGLDAEYCIHSVVVAALNREYKVSVIPEAIISNEESGKDKTLRQFRTMGVEIIPLDSLLTVP